MKKALIGYGGHAREVMAQMGLNLPCFVDDEYQEGNSLPLSLFSPNEYSVMVAISNSEDRSRVIQRLPKETNFFTFVHPTSIIMGEVYIGKGSFVGANSILTTNIKIGDHSILNRANHIGHDCMIGNYLSMMPGSIISGNVTIGNKFYLGTNSSIREKIKIADSVSIGMSSCVVRDIKESGAYVGVPASKKIK